MLMKQLPHNDTTKPFKGYTLDELRYNRAYLLAVCEMQKMRLMQRVDAAKNTMPGFTGSGIVGKIMGSLNYVDYALIAFRIISKVSRIFRRR